MDKAESPRCKKLRLIHPADLVPEDLVNFIELKSFTREWKKLGLPEQGMDALSVGIMAAPRAPAVIPGTGGLRKMRFAPPGRNVGKRGGLRVCYAFFEDLSVVVFVTVYAKNQKDDLSKGERNAIKKLLSEIRRELAKDPTKG